MSNPRLIKYAPIGLYLSGLAAVAALVLYILQQKFSLPVQISLGLIVVGLAVFVLLDPQRTRQALGGRQAKYGSNALVLSVAFVGILAVVNVLGTNYSHQWDLTQGQEHTLAPESLKALDALPQKVTAEAFFTNQTPTTDAKTLLENYKQANPGKFDYRFIDPNADPVSAQQANVTQDGTVVLTMGNRQEKVTTVTEQGISSALVRLANPGQHVIYFLSGHGERDYQGSANTGFSQAATTLQSKNYTIKTLNLINTQQVPADASALVLAGPQQPLTQQEVQRVQDYLDKGGSLVYLSAPAFSSSSTGTTTTPPPSGTSDPLQAYLSQNWGIQLDNDVVVDPNVNQPLIAASASYGSHAITQSLSNVVTFYPSARSLTLGQAPQNVTVTPLVSTASNTWGETDFASIQSGSPTYQAGTDKAGPLTIAVAATNSQTNARLVVAGDVDFGSDALYSTYGDGDMLINIIDWAARQDQMISLTAKQPVTRSLRPPSSLTLSLTLLGTVVLLPGAFLVGGISTWLARRRRR
jgi:ABC-type uncharacterized transport system involved in gliding motility auxiliary subunit